MKKAFIGLMTLSMFVLSVSCEKDAPEINFSQNTSIEVDLSDLLAAIEDLSISLDTKLDLLKTAIESQTLTLTQKLDLLNTAIETLSLTLTQKLDLLNSAIETQTLTLAQKLDLLNSVIETQSLELSGKLALIETAVKKGLLDVKTALDSTKEALISSLDEHFADTQESLDAVNKALSALVVDGGIYEYDKANQRFFMSNSTWDLLNTDEELAAVFATYLSTTNFTFRINQANPDYKVTFTETPDKTTLRLLREKTLFFYNKNDKTIVPAGDGDGKDYDREILIPAVGVIKTYNRVVYTCTLTRTDGGDLNGATFGSYNLWLNGSTYYGPFYDMRGKTESDLTMTYANSLNVINYLPQITMNVSVPANI